VVVCVELDDLQLAATLDLLDALDVDEVPIAVTVIGGGSRAVGRLPAFPTPERAATAMSLACGWAAWRARDSSGDAADIAVDPARLIASRRLARRLAADAEATTWLWQDTAFELLETAGVPIVSWAYVRSEEECAGEVVRRGRPCVVKADLAGAVSKSDEGAVRLEITDVDTAANVYRDFTERFGDRLNGVVVQSQVAAGLELQVAATRDPAFGPFVVVGAGGVEAEVRADRAVLVAPITPAEARYAVAGLHLAPLFGGFRGRPALALDAVVELVTRVAMLIAAVPEIHQVDLNPVIVGTTGCVVVDARVGVSSPASPITPTRGLRGSVTTLG
jgi:hypothetical protein